VLPFGVFYTAKCFVLKNSSCHPIGGLLHILDAGFIFGAHGHKSKKREVKLKSLSRA
jgi:hypothetical protein